MNNVVNVYKLFSDGNRIRILMLLCKKELSVCQLMGITGASQPLVSRNLSLLYKGGFLEERRDGKLRFYSLKKELPVGVNEIIEVLKKQVKNEPLYIEDMNTLKECSEFQKKAGRCDMKTLKDFMEWKIRRKKSA